MLFILTGEVQTGKTRWLEHLVSRLTCDGMTCSGVLAPGIWRRRKAGGATGDRRAADKPKETGCSIPYLAACGANGPEEGPFPAEFPGQAGCLSSSTSKGLPLSAPMQGLAGRGEFEKLGIENVLLPDGECILFARRRDLSQRDGSFDPSSQSAAAQLAWDISDAALARVNGHFASIAACAGTGSDDGGVLVVDELGRLELLCGGGLTEAVALLEAGPTAAFPHAVIVVRAGLLEHAKKRFALRWDGCEVILPDDAGSEAIRLACGI